jgi:integral membrane protein
MQTENVKALLHRFRMVGLAEGISLFDIITHCNAAEIFLISLQAVKVFGWVHGALFVTYVWLHFEVFGTCKKTMGWFAKSFITAFLPMGTFYTDKELKKEEEAL